MVNNTIATNNFLPVVKSFDASFFQYLREINKFPVLTPQEEYDYAMRYQKDGDNFAAKMLVQSHLRLVVKIASKFRQYGLPIVDLVSEGNVGLIQAVKKFEPQKGFRFSTYAIWWIKAYIQEYVLKSWSLVKIGTTVAQKKLFFNLRKIKKKLNADEGNLLPQHVKIIAEELNVSPKEVIDMNSRLQNSDSSLNRLVADDSDVEIGDQIQSLDDNQEELAIKSQEQNESEEMVKLAFKKLNDREKAIIKARQLDEKSQTLEVLSSIYKVSRERIRQIEAGALEKMRREILRLRALS